MEYNPSKVELGLGSEFGPGAAGCGLELWILGFGHRRRGHGGRGGGFPKADRPDW